MKLHLINRKSTDNCSWTVRKNSGKHFLKLWHYHPELELVVILKSTGFQFIGDSIETFGQNDLILIGKNLPHMWFNDDPYFRKDSDLTAEAIAVHFREDVFGEGFLTMPEMRRIAELFQRARCGIKFFNIGWKIRKEISNLIQLENFERTLHLIRILDKLARHNQYKLLASEGYLSSLEHTENKSMDEIYAYVFNNFKKGVDLETAAQIANMNPSAFSRSFKRINQKSFTKYVNEIRIGFACRLLMENKLNITAICYESGFRNLSNFNRQFKLIMNMSPSEFQSHYHKK
ncbi:MAG: AraC family transcriptional regulator [Bacteroidota bacterium]